MKPLNTVLSDTQVAFVHRALGDMVRMQVWVERLMSLPFPEIDPDPAGRTVASSRRSFAAAQFSFSTRSAERLIEENGPQAVLSLRHIFDAVVACCRVRDAYQVRGDARADEMAEIVHKIVAGLVRLLAEHHGFNSAEEADLVQSFLAAS